MLRLIGQALLVQHRVSGRVAVEEKPDVLWDRSDLERLYARLEDEYEFPERAGVLKRKLDVIVETAQRSPTSSTPTGDPPRMGDHHADRRGDHRGDGPDLARDGRAVGGFASATAPFDPRIRRSSGAGRP